MNKEETKLLLDRLETFYRDIEMLKSAKAQHKADMSLLWSMTRRLEEKVKQHGSSIWDVWRRVDILESKSIVTAVLQKLGLSPKERPYDEQEEE